MYSTIYLIACHHLPCIISLFIFRASSRLCVIDAFISSRHFSLPCRIPPPTQVVLPLGAGQWLRACHHAVGEKADAWKPQLGTLASFTLLVIIYTTFCNTFCQVRKVEEEPKCVLKKTRFKHSTFKLARKRYRAWFRALLRALFFFFLFSF